MKTIKYYLSFTDAQIEMTGINSYLDKLRTSYDLVETNDCPDVIFYCEDRFDYLKYKNSIRVFWCVENIQPNFSLCDYAIGNCRLNYCDRYFRYPYYMLPQNRYMYFEAANRYEMTADELHHKTSFCNFIYSNAYCDIYRKSIYEMLSKYKFVHSAGAYLNNTEKPPIGMTWEETFLNKINYQKNFKFTLAIENSSAYGYVSEKIINAFQARTIPIYWGDPYITNSINPECFINCHDYDSIDAVVERVAEVDSNDDLYLKIFNTDINVGDWRNDGNILDREFLAFLNNIFDKGYIHRNYSIQLHDFKEENRYSKGLYAYEKHVHNIQLLKSVIKKIIYK